MRTLKNVKLIQMMLLAIAALFFIQNTSYAKDSKTTDGLITVSAAWVRAMPPGIKTTAGFLSITNNSDKDIKLVGVFSLDFGTVSLYRTFVTLKHNTDDYKKDDYKKPDYRKFRSRKMLRMRKYESVTIRTKQTLNFKPGDWHLMLFKPKKNISPNTKFLITLQFDNNQAIIVPFVARRM